MRLIVQGGRINISLTGSILGRSTEKEAKKTFQAYKKYLVQVLIKNKKEKEIDVDWQKLEDLEQKIRLLLLPKDANDEKSIIMEIRAGAGAAGLAGHEILRVVPGP